MITYTDLTIVKAWDELNKINNKINLLETLISTTYDIGSSKLKEILTQCSTGKSNDRFLNSIFAKDERISQLVELENSKLAYENYIRDEIDRLKLSESAVCIAFLKDYMRKTWDEIAKKMDDLSVSQCRRYYDEYKGRTPKDNSYFNENMPVKSK